MNHEATIAKNVSPGQSGVIVCERQGTWGTALGQQLPPGVPMRSARWLGDCLVALAAAPHSVVLLEWTRKNFAGVLELIVQCRKSYPACRVLVLCEPELAPWQALALEAGAAHSSLSRRELAGAAGVIVRHLARVPKARTNVATQVWNRLPWGE